MIHRRNFFSYDLKFKLFSGKSLDGFKLVYDTYGNLNKKKDNTIIVFHAFSGSHHAAGKFNKDRKLGWWDKFIGPKKIFDTNKYFVLCVNNLGSCFGSSGPLSVNKSTGKEYGSTFPSVHVKDWVKTHKILLDSLRINKIQYVVGSSLGGMQALEFLALKKFSVKKGIIIGATPKPSYKNLAMNYIQREMLNSDDPESLTHTRMLSHLNYISNKFLKREFSYRKEEDSKKINPNIEYEFQNYLHYHGRNFSKIFNKNSYILMTKAMDSYFFDTKNYKSITGKLLLISFEHDELFSHDDMSEFHTELIKNNVKSVHKHIKGSRGHDSFLYLTKDYQNVLNEFIS